MSLFHVSVKKKVIMVKFQFKQEGKFQKKIKSLENNDKFSPFSLLVTENESDFTQNLEKET